MTQVMVGVSWYGHPTDASHHLHKIIRYAITPQDGDYIELLPAQYDADGKMTISSMHMPVKQRWIHTSEPDYKVEVRVELGRLTDVPEDLQTIEDLRKGGFS